MLTQSQPVPQTQNRNTPYSNKVTIKSIHVEGGKKQLTVLTTILSLNKVFGGR